MPDIPPERPTTPSLRDPLEPLQREIKKILVEEEKLAPLAQPQCHCAQIMRDDPTRHFKGCPKRVERDPTTLMNGTDFEALQAAKGPQIRVGVRDGMMVALPARPTFSSIYMRLAEAMAERSTCARLHVGCVIVTPDYRKVLSVGYNGNVSGGNNDCDRHGEEAVGNCGCIHAEQNAVINCDAPRSTPKIVYCTNLPCVMCAKFLINLGNVEKVTYKHDYRIQDALQLFDMHGIKYLHTP